MAVFSQIEGIYVFQKMNLAIDFGNSFTKAGLFEREDLKKVITDIEPGMLEQVIETYAPDQIIISSVSKSSTEISKELGRAGDIATFLRHDMPLPFTIDYTTPETLGLDRLAAVAGAHGIFPDTDCLVIDTGTCFTYDLIDRKRVYHGGSISPGIDMRFKALHNFTANLPLVTFDENLPLIGKSTEKAIQSGVINGAIAEITEIIRMYSDKFANLQIIICGGGTKFFEKKLKASIFAAPELVLRGLNRILLYNA